MITFADFLRVRGLPLILLPYDISIVALLLAFLPALDDQSVHLEELADDSLPLKRCVSMVLYIINIPLERSNCSACSLSCALSRALSCALRCPWTRSPSFEVVHTFSICSSF